MPRQKSVLLVLPYVQSVRFAAVIYLVMFGFTTVFLYAGSNCRGILRGVLVALGLLLPCFLAGVRDPAIGTDVYSYAIWMFRDASVSDFFTFMQNQSSIAALGWNVMTWLAVNVSGSFEFYLFTIEAFCILPIYFGLKRLAPNYEWTGMLAWLLVLYAFSLNGMRQSVAIGFVFYSLSFIANRSLFKFAACILVAMLFHQTAAIGLALYPLAWLTRKEGAMGKMFGRWKSFAAIFLVTTILMLVFAFGEQLVLMLAFLKKSYSYQVQHLGSGDVSLASLYLLAGCFAVWIISRNDFSDTGRDGETGLASQGADSVFGGCECESISKTLTGGTIFRLATVFACTGNALAQLNYISDSLARLGLYGTVFVCAMVVALMANGKRSRGHALVLITVCVVYFIVMIMVLGKEQVYPYSSSVLGVVG